MGCVVLAACAAAVAEGERAEPDPELLASSLEVEVRADSVRLALHVTNTADRAMRLDFPSGQRYDFAVHTPDGRELWRWSADRAFTQAVGSEVLEAQGTVTYRASWAPPVRDGDLIAVAELVASNAPLRRETRFQLRG